MEQLPILTKDEVKTVLTALLFSCSINVVSDSSPEMQTKMFDLAKNLKQCYPDVQLENLQFLQEENYEENISVELLEAFKENINQITFEQV